MPTSTARPIRERRDPPARGFSLLEVTATLAVVALAAGLVVPRLVGRAAGTLDAVARDVSQRLTAARWQALIEGHDVRVSLDDLPPGLRADGHDALAFAPVPAALPRTLVLVDARGAIARITVPAGLAALTIAYEAPS